MSDNHATTLVAAPVEAPAALGTQQMHPLVSAAMGRGELNPEILEKLLDLQDRWEANEARKAYARALVGLKDALPAVVAHDKVVDFEGGKSRTTFTHTTLAAVMEAIDEPLTAHGFTVSWRSGSDGKAVKVVCRLTHVEGHYEETDPLVGPPDTKGGKSVPQGIASTITIFKRHALLGLLGIATADTDGIDPRLKKSESPEGPPTTRERMRAAAGLAGVGVTKATAEAHVQRTMDEWTRADIDVLRDLYNAKVAERAGADS